MRFSLRMFSLYVYIHVYMSSAHSQMRFSLRMFSLYVYIHVYMSSAHSQMRFSISCHAFHLQNSGFGIFMLHTLTHIQFRIFLVLYLPANYIVAKQFFFNTFIWVEFTAFGVWILGNIWRFVHVCICRCNPFAHTCIYVCICKSYNMYIYAHATNIVLKMNMVLPV